MSYHHWFRPFCAVSQHHVSMAQLIQKQLRAIIYDLEDAAAWIPGRIHEHLNMIRPLFDAEEILMIQSHYPDYDFQKNAHCCFMRKMTQLNKSGDFIETEQYAADWLHSHETLSGALFHHYLQKRAGRYQEPEETLLIELNPEYVLLPVKIIKPDQDH